MSFFGGLGFGFSQQIEEQDRLEELREKLRPARLRGKKFCVKCGFCCHARTCIPTPSELKKIATFLKLTPKALIKKYYAIDRKSGDEIYYVKPLGKNIKDLAGKFIPASRTFNEGDCVFLGKNNLCKIYPVRPATAKASKCWLQDKDKENIITEQTIKKWGGNQLKKQFGIDGNKEEEKVE